MATYPAQFDKVIKTVADIDPPTGNGLACEWGNPQACQDDNNERAELAGLAVKAYAKQAGGLNSEEPETVIGDLLNDLRHLCDALGLNFEAIAAHDTNYQAELRGEF